MAYLSLADLEGKFSFNSLSVGIIGFLSFNSNKIFGCSNLGTYRDTLWFSDKLLKKYFTILSSKEWNVTTAKTPSFLIIFVADIRPLINSLISLFTKILKAWKTFVALCILKFFFFFVFSIKFTKDLVSIVFIFLSLTILFAIFFASFSSPKNLKIFSNSL